MQKAQLNDPGQDWNPVCLIKSPVRSTPGHPAFDPRLLTYLLIKFSFTLQNCTSNIVAVGIKPDVSKSELIKIALGSPDRALKVESPDHLNSGVISKIEGVLKQPLSMDDLDAWLSEQM